MKKILSLITSAALLLSITSEIAMADYDKAIYDLKNLRIINGFEDGEMHENDILTRAQAAAIIMRASGFDDAKWYKSEIKQFKDTPISHWASGYVYRAVYQNIISGINDSEFAPDENVTLEQALKMIIILLGYDNGTLEYPDGFITKARELGILNNITLNPSDALKRGDLAVLVYNALDVKPSNSSASSLRDSLTIVKESEDTNKSYPVSGSLYETVKTEAMVSDSAGGGGGKSSSDFPFDRYYEAPAVSEPYSEVTDIGVLPPDYIGQEQPIPGQLTAGCWRDTENWEFWRRLMGNKEYSQLQKKWEIPTDKYDVIVKSDEVPARDCKIEVLNAAGDVIWSSVTDKEGKAFIFIPQNSADEQQSDFTLALYPNGERVLIENVILDNENPLTIDCLGSEPENIVDLMFTIDTTGSMSDELRYINEELKDVVSRIDSNVRISCNYYRDTSDAYVVKPFDFTTNIDLVTEQISMQYAAGGGDYEEAVDLALLNSVDEHDWSESARARLLFLVLDAPPHFTPEVVENIRTAVNSASKKGIRIVPVASSGVDKNTEFFLRSLAIATNGIYIFLTNHSGIGNSHIEPTIGDYDVQYLNELILKVINDYIE